MGESIRPIFATNGQKLNITRFVAQQICYLQEKLFLQIAGNIAGKGAKLHSVQSIIQALIGNLGTDSVVGDVVNK